MDQPENDFENLLLIAEDYGLQVRCENSPLPDGTGGVMCTLESVVSHRSSRTELQFRGSGFTKSEALRDALHNYFDDLRKHESANVLGGVEERFDSSDERVKMKRADQYDNFAYSRYPVVGQDD